MLDLSPDHVDNTNENKWEVNDPFPTEAEIEAGAAKAYEAQLWSRAPEEITFHVKFSAGSHMQITWGIDEPAAYANDDCLAMDKPTGAPAWPNDPEVTFVDTGDSSPCIFPFRYGPTEDKQVLYYGCANVTLSGSTYKMCATATDEDYNAQTLKWCGDDCHVQFPREAEVEGSEIDKETQVFSETEGTSNVYQEVYTLALETEVELKRTFT